MEIRIEPTFQHVTWIVKEFFELSQENGYFLDSPIFLFSGDSYCLRLHPKENGAHGAQTAFHVRRLSVTFPERKVSCKIGLRCRERNGSECYNYNPLPLRKKYSYPRSYIEKGRDEYVPDGSLTVLCSMRLSVESKAGSSAPGEEEQEGFSEHNASFSSRGSPAKMELSTESPCTRVVITVPNSLELPKKTGDSLTSPEFRFAGDTYCFRLRWNGDTEDINLQLVRLTFSFPDRTVSYRVGRGWNDSYDYPNNSVSLVGFCVSLSQLKEESIKYEGFGVLKLALFLRVLEQNSAGDSDAAQKRCRLPDVDKLQFDYWQLLQKETESDACFVVRGKEFKAHRVVLRARSTVFEAMFSHDMAEKRSGQVVVDDLDPDNFEDFLQYLYSGDVGLWDENAFGLYMAADKYGVSTLKSKCLEHMRQTLSVDSFCYVMTLALIYREEDLLRQATSFFKDNIKGIIITEEWQEFMCDNPTSANELLIKAIMPGK